MTYHDIGSESCALFISSVASATLPRPGKTTFHVPFAARTRRTWCCINSWSFGTSASFARLPNSELVKRSRVKVGGILMVSTGAGESADGGVIVT